MPDLASFQRGLAASLLDPASRHPLSSQPGFAVYRNTCTKGVVDALRAAYPTVEMLIGKGQFDWLAVDFFRRRPPVSPMLASYGEGFADHLEGQPWVRELPYLPDIARLDRLRLESHLAADASALAAGDLARVKESDWMKLRLKLHPAARFAWLSTPAMSIWLAHQGGEPIEEMAPEWHAEGALFARPFGGAVDATRIDRPTDRLLCGLRLGETIGEAASAVAATYPETDISRLFAEVMASGALLMLQERNG